MHEWMGTKDGALFVSQLVEKLVGCVRADCASLSAAPSSVALRRPVRPAARRTTGPHTPRLPPPRCPCFLPPMPLPAVHDCFRGHPQQRSKGGGGAGPPGVPAAAPQPRASGGAGPPHSRVQSCMHVLNPSLITQHRRRCAPQVCAAVCAAVCVHTRVSCWPLCCDLPPQVGAPPASPAPPSHAILCPPSCVQSARSQFLGPSLVRMVEAALPHVDAFKVRREGGGCQGAGSRLCLPACTVRTRCVWNGCRGTRGVWQDAASLARCLHL